MKVYEKRVENKVEEPSLLHCLLMELFSRLDDMGVLYCVLRNYEGLPEYVENDIDLFVHPRDVETFKQCLLLAAKHNGWVLIKNPSRFAWEAFWLKSTFAHEFVEIDIISVLYWKGIPWADTDWIINKRKRMKHFFVPDQATEAGILLIKDVIQNGKIREKYLEKIYEATSEVPVGFQGFLTSSLGNSVATWLQEKVQKRAWHEIEEKKTKIRIGAIGHTFSQNPLGIILNFVKFLLGHLRSRLVKPSGMFVVLIGPDGSGKSSVAEGLRDFLKPVFRRQQYYHGRFGILPRLRAFKKLALRAIGWKASLEPVCGADQYGNYNGKHSLSRILIYVMYYSVDYLFGHWVVRKSKAIGDLIIFDRYFYDWFIQSYLEHVPRWILPVLKLIYPRPDLVVYLHNSSDIIHHRKPELTAEQIEGQSRKCQRIMQDIPYGITISTSPALNEVVKEVAKKVEQIMLESYQGNWQ